MDKAEVVRLAAEYECYPLWRPTVSGVDNIPASDLPISQSLADEVQSWAEEYESTYDPDDPLSSGFSTPDEENAFTARGREVAKRLAEELGLNWRVFYSPPGTGEREEMTASE